MKDFINLGVIVLLSVVLVCASSDGLTSHAWHLFGVFIATIDHYC